MLMEEGMNANTKTEMQSQDSYFYQNFQKRFYLSMQARDSQVATIQQDN